MITNIARTLFILSTATLISCGGGSSSSSSSVADTTPTWTENVFEDESSFKNRCENPRTGQDINGDDYADTAGSILHEQHWLRSWSNNTYLWYNEIIDQDVADFSTPQSYFDVLRTLQTTNSGQLRDRFHFWQNTADSEQSTSGGSSVGFGAELFINGEFPRVVRITYVEPNSPAAEADIRRGAEILFVDGINVKTGSDVDGLVNGLFPEAVGEEHTFVIQAVGETEPRTVVLEADAVTTEPVHNTKVIETETGKVGYLTFNTFGTFTAEKALFDAFTTLQEQEVSDLVIDLRYNGGGLLATSSQLGYMVAGSDLSNDKVFETLVYNDKHPTISPISGEIIRPFPFIDVGVGFSVNANEPLPALNLNRVFVLTSEDTCSASESLINGLLGIDVEVILIGGTTCGKPYGFVPTDNCGTTYFTVQFRGENEKGFGDYAEGFAPSNTTTLAGEKVTGCQVDDDLDHLLGDENEAMLQAALAYRETGTCPSVTAGRAKASSYNPLLDLRNDPRLVERKFFKEARLNTHYIK